MCIYTTRLDTRLLHTWTPCKAPRVFKDKAAALLVLEDTDGGRGVMYREAGKRCCRRVPVQGHGPGHLQLGVGTEEKQTSNPSRFFALSRMAIPLGVNVRGGCSNDRGDVVKSEDVRDLCLVCKGLDSPVESQGACVFSLDPSTRAWQVRLWLAYPLLWRGY